MVTPGLRERKKERTRHAIADAAIALFQEKGFDAVSVAEVAAAAEVSKPTVFAYFPTKEDLVLHRVLEHQDEPARVVRDREPGESPLGALRRHFLAGLDRHEPSFGLDDDPQVLAYLRLVLSTPSLVARMTASMLQSEALLADALAECPGYDVDTAYAAAAQIYAVQRILATRNIDELAAGRTADEVHPEAVARARAAFDLLEHGLEHRRGGAPRRRSRARR